MTETTPPPSRLAQRSLAAQQFLDNKAIATTLVARPGDFAPPATAAATRAGTALAGQNPSEADQQETASSTSAARPSRAERRQAAAAKKRAAKQAAEQARRDRSAAKLAEREAATKAKQEAEAARIAHQTAAETSRAQAQLAKVPALAEPSATAPRLATDSAIVAEDDLDDAYEEVSEDDEDDTLEHPVVDEEVLQPDPHDDDESWDILPGGTPEHAAVNPTSESLPAPSDGERLPTWLVTVFCGIVLMALILCYLFYTGSLLGLVDYLGKAF